MAKLISRITGLISGIIVVFIGIPLSIWAFLITINDGLGDAFARAILNPVLNLLPLPASVKEGLLAQPWIGVGIIILAIYFLYAKNAESPHKK
jgi:hypothetical protein